MLILAQGPESRLRAKILHLIHAVFHVIGRLHLIHLELRLGTVQFRQQRLKQAVALCRRVCRHHRRVQRRF